MATRLKILILVIAVISFAGTYTPNRNLYKPARNEKNWDASFNSNFDNLDSHVHTGSTISGLGTVDFSSGNISQWTNDSGYLDGETDPVFLASPSHSINANSIDNWNKPTKILTSSIEYENVDIPAVDGNGGFAYTNMSYYEESITYPRGALQIGSGQVPSGILKVNDSVGSNVSSLSVTPYGTDITATDGVNSASFSVSSTGTYSSKDLLVGSNSFRVVTTTGKFIMTSPDGSCSECGPDNSDVFACSSIACP